MKTVAKALVFDDTGSILLLRRSLTHPNYPHHYDFPGGEVENGEGLCEASRRELLEETGLVVCKKDVVVAFKRQITPSLLHIICQIKLFETQPPVMLSWEHDDFIWLTLNELLSSPIPENPDDYYQTVLEYLRKT